MIKATFYKKDEILKGFEIEGHSGYAEEGEDIICASVSSVAYMAVNTITDVIGAKADISISDGYFRFITDSVLNETKVVLEGLMLHVSALAGDYSEFITCKEETL
ncbi:MAG: ribosomal-processing cysteine protease Prp [Clostridia bacterium]|nr:ribosomal-processing cysteine protease Prp [Clostridia bacterium]